MINGHLPACVKQNKSPPTDLVQNSQTISASNVIIQIKKFANIIQNVSRSMRYLTFKIHYRVHKIPIALVF